jgi:hypothetical protein
MRVALVHPAGYNFCPGQPDLTLFANRMAPIGILSLASWLDKHGHETMLLDCLGPNAPKTTEETVQRILAFKPDMVGFSTTTSAFLDGYDIASQIKQKHPEIKTIFGAVHPSSIGGQLLEYFPNADYLCVGEARSWTSPTARRSGTFRTWSTATATTSSRTPGARASTTSTSCRSPHGTSSTASRAGTTCRSSATSSATART